MTKTVLGTLLVIGAVCALAMPGAAQEVKIEGKVELNALSVTGFVKGRRYVVDAAYAEKMAERYRRHLSLLGQPRQISRSTL